MTDIDEPICRVLRCRHYTGFILADEDTGDPDFVVCTAFPDGIPDNILRGENQHDSPVAGDGGILFEEDN